MYSILTEDQRETIYTELIVNQRSHSESRKRETTCFIALKNGLSVIFTVNEMDILTIFIRSMRNETEADSFTEISTDCKKAVSDVKKFLKTLVKDTANFQIENGWVDDMDGSDCVTSVTLRFDSELLDIPTETFEIEINGATSTVDVPSQQVEENKTREYITEHWWSSLSPKQKLRKAGLGQKTVSSDVTINKV